MKKQNSFDAVLFDLDGTLVDSAEDIAHAVNHVRQSMKLEVLPLEQVRSYVGDGVRVLMERALKTSSVRVLDQAIECWRPWYEQHCLDHAKPYAGIENLLKKLNAQEVPMGVVSNKLESLSEVMIRGLNLRHFFGAVVGGDSASAHKPDPAPLRLALQRMCVSSNRVLMVGDSPNDIVAGKALGFQTCGVLWGIVPKEVVLRSKPHHVVEKASQLFDLISGSLQ